MAAKDNVKRVIVKPVIQVVAITVVGKLVEAAGEVDVDSHPSILLANTL